MARGRMLNRSVSVSLKFHELPDDTCRLLATWTIPFLDKRGVFYASPSLVKSFVIPMRDDIDTHAIDRYIRAMEAVGLVRVFASGGREWQYWPGFADNQIGLRDDRESSEFPPPPSTEIPTGSNDDCGSYPEGFRQVSGNMPAEVNGIERNINVNGREGKVTGATAPARTPTVPSDLRNQPRPPTQKQKARAELDRQTNPAILAWRNVFKDAKRQLNPVQVSQIIRVVTDSVKWGTVCTEWALRGFSETNVEGLLDVYVNGWRNPGSNGKSEPAQRGKPFRRPQVAYTDEQREASRKAAAYNLKLRAYCKAHGLDPRKDVIDRAKVEAWTPGGNHER